jgi:uncharacterized protein
VDVGVHQDGLVHVSAMSKNFVSDPREVVKSGDIVKVKVMDVDLQRKRIALSLRLDDEVGVSGGRTSGGSRSGGDGAGGQGSGGQGGGQRGGRPGGEGRGRNGRGQGGPGQGGQGGRGRPAPADTAMADALRKAGLA